jgi:hypothetical protein
MAFNDVMQLRAKAKAAGVAGYKAMNADELKKALNGSGSKTSAKTAVSKSAGSGRETAAGRKTAASVKSAPAKTAKRQTTGARKAAPSRTAKSTPKAEQPKRGRPAGSKSAKKTDGASSNYHGGRNLIDNSEIDWRANWAVGGIRGEIFKVLRKHKGDTDKTYDELAPRAQEFWKKNRAGERILKEQALNTLRWNISRVKFDFVMATGQHKPSKKFGTLGTGQGKKTAPKSTQRKASPQKPAQKATGAKRGRPAGSKNKPKATTARKRAYLK